MSGRLKLYVAFVALLAAAVALALDWGGLLSLRTGQLLGLSSFVLIAFLSQALAVDSTIVAAKPVRSSIAFLPLLAAAVYFPPAAAVTAALIVTVSDELTRANRQVHRALFNTSQAIIAYGVGSILFQALAPPDPFHQADAHASVFLAFYGLAVPFFLVNAVLVSGFVAIRQQERFFPVFQEATGRGGGNLLYDLLASPVALFAAYLFHAYGVGGLLAVVLPLLLIRYSYLSAIQLERANRDLLRVLIKAIETRDPYTSGHSLRVSTLAKMIAEDHGLRSRVVNQVETAALLHDIGKIDALYAEIISKPADLTEHERSIIQTHATKGADLLQSLTSLEREIIVGVRHHHERYDGGGYPAGLSGKAIPLAARIIMLCDSIDAMLSDRPYRRALPIQEVREELRRCAGSQFDPDLVETILRSNTVERANLLVDRSTESSRRPRAVIPA